jgi:AGCS family alanine or glycine:cation symporter
MNIIESLNALIMYKIFGIPFLIIILFGGALINNYILSFINLRFIGHAFSLLFKKRNAKSDEISSFSSLMSSVGGTLGIGNIVGSAVAIYIGGPGTLFWILIIGFIVSGLKFTEVYLSHKYRLTSKDSVITGGAFVYIKEGIGNVMGLKKFAKILNFLYIPSFLIAYSSASMFQAQQISVTLLSQEVLSQGVQSSTMILYSIIFFILLLIILLGGIKRIGSISEKIVPIMIFIYMFLVLYQIISNINNLPSSISLIISDAFNQNSMLGGVVFTIAYAAQRMIFGGEIATGISGVINSNSNVKNSVEQAMIVGIEPIFVSILMFLSGLAIITTIGYDPEITYEGVNYIYNAYSLSSLPFAIPILKTVICLFGVTTIIGNGYVFEKCIYFVFGSKSTIIRRIGQVVFCIYIVSGLFMPMKSVLALGDLTFIMMLIPNVIAMLALSMSVKKDSDKYISSIKK